MTSDPLYVEYHDAEWGVPLYNDAELFELLVLETFQTGLSWLTVLKKRENFRAAFDSFDASKMARYGEVEVQALMSNPGIIRNRRAQLEAVADARAFLNVQEAFGSFARYAWDFSGGEPIVNTWESAAEVPATTPLSSLFSKDLKRRGFGFVGPTVVYAFMQASGMVMDHTTGCFRCSELTNVKETLP